MKQHVGNRSTEKKGVVLITGGSGLIGQAVARRLSLQFQVISLDMKEPA